MLPYRICLIQPWTEAENAYNDDEEARQLRRTERLYEQWGKDWKKVPDIGASFKVRQRMLWEQRREQDRLSLAAIASGLLDRIAIDLNIESVLVSLSISNPLT